MRSGTKQNKEEKKQQQPQQLLLLLVVLLVVLLLLEPAVLVSVQPKMGVGARKRVMGFENGR